MTDPKHEDEAATRARRGRNILLASALLGFVIVVFLITIAKISGNAPH